MNRICENVYKKNDVIVFEPNMNSTPHSEVNAGFLSLLQSIYEKDHLVFIADKRHLQSVEQLICLNNWKCIKSMVFDYVPKFFVINEIVLICKIIIIFFKTSKDDKIFFLGIMPFAHIILSFLNIIYKREIFICLHGQMEAYINDTKIGKTKYYYRLSKFVFKKTDNLDYIFLGESIKRNLLFLFNKNKRLIAIDHPYLYEKINQIEKQNSPWVLGFVGRFDSTKNVKEFFCFIDGLKKEILDNKIKIKIVGKVNCGIPQEYASLFTFHVETLSKTQFQTEINELDFVISFIDNNYYKVTPSGVFFDCIKWQIPILTLDNDFVSYYFEKYGKIGEIFSKTDKMIGFVKENLKNKKSDKIIYTDYISNIISIKDDISISKLKHKFISQL